MAAFMRGFEAHTYALLRIVVGFLFLWHGAQKLIGFPAEFSSPMNPMLWIASIIELGGGTLVMVGFQTRWAAFLCSGLMATAYWMVHGSQMFSGAMQFFPLLNKGELAALYCFVFLFISARGPGIWSVDGER
jgi:putative oxidoreductase